MRSKIFLSCLLLVVGHTTASALDTQREDVKAFIVEVSKQHHLKASTIQSLLRNAESKPAIIETMTRPAEQVTPWYDYRDRFLNEKRIDKGVDFWKTQTKWLDRAEKSTGVTPETILGILGVETRFGEITGNYRVLDALATLGFDYPPRSEFFRSELKEFILLTREERIDVRKALGSYAGAIGAPQFMPSNYRKLAVDGDGNGRRDLWGSWPDVIMSVANYLQSHGWHRDEPVVASATLDVADLSKFDTTKIRLNETVASLRAKGARFETSQPDDTPAMLIVLEGRDGNEYRVGFHNFVMISRYNPRVKYALAVYDLGDAIVRAKADAQH